MWPGQPYKHTKQTLHSTPAFLHIPTVVLGVVEAAACAVFLLAHGAGPGVHDQAPVGGQLPQLHHAVLATRQDVLQQHQ